MESEKKLIGIYGVRIYEQNVLYFIEELKKASKKKGYQLISFSGNSNVLEETDEIEGQYQLIELISYIDISALVLLTETIKNEKVIQKLLDLGRTKHIPVFSLDRKVTGCYSILMDNKNGFEQIVRHVVEEHHCRYVNMIAGFKDNRFSQERVDIFQKVLRENGIPFEEERFGYGDFWERPTIDVMERFLKCDLPFPEAIICANDTMAIMAIAVLNRHGYEVPEDVIVTGYDGIKDGDDFFPSMTTGCTEYKETIAQIFTVIEEWSESSKTDFFDIVTPIIVKKRQSCGCEKKRIGKHSSVISEIFTEKGEDVLHIGAMRQLISDTFEKNQIEDIIKVLPKHMRLWSNNYRALCVKSELFYSTMVSKEYTEMISILECDKEGVRNDGKKWNINKLQDYVQRILMDDDIDTIVVHLLNAGKKVYGFTVDGFDKMNEWKLKRCDEFSLFLSQTFNAVVHNQKMSEMNQRLHKVNKEIEELSVRDSLTGLYNRRGFFLKMNKTIIQEENKGKYLYIFFVDADGLKYINDTYGHVEGDFAIVTIAKALLKMGKEDTICARFGGDEFICSFTEENERHHTADEFRIQMESLVKEMESVSNKPYSMAFSVGMVFEEISDSLDLDVLIRDADDKMYENKIARKKMRS